LLPFVHIGPLTLGTYGLMVAAALLCAFFVLRRELARRQLAADPHAIIGMVGLAGLLGSKLWHALETPAEFFTHPLQMILSPLGFAYYGAIVGGFLMLVGLARHYRVPMLEMLDAVSPAAALGYGIGRIGCLISGDGDYGIPTSLPWGMSFPNGLVPTTQRVHPTPIYEFLGAVVIFLYLRHLALRSLRKPMPAGEVFANYLVWTGLARFLVEFIRLNPRTVFGMSNAQAASVISVIAGLSLFTVVKQSFHQQSKLHRILNHKTEHGDVLQPEYHRATPECPHPERWHMFDSMTAEVEVLEFLKSVVTTLKPELVVETGTFIGISTIWIAQGLKQNGFGRVISCESDPKVFAKAQERIES